MRAGDQKLRYDLEWPYRMKLGTQEKVKSRDHSNVIRRTIQMYHESMCKLIDWSNSSDNNILLSA